ncbi:signal peptidase II [Alloalcanivorax mobilis]|uniref:signal peptidase II n=1 Tax=Alloalcanivorax mobilis TaxID=2019569 RepID=UPI000B5B1EEF|nr:signal peptidase II [Alloalcanivorax mobilis]ASK35078.1 signal peptidase II [Alcanivorax sp. N3-2A]|tara:strand:- start:17138 stop:17650 length:513 start_codon:yes stop_codon:yes gene_type:complete
MPEAIKAQALRKGQLGWLWLTVLVIALDQISKHLIVGRFQLYERLEVSGFFNLTLAYNTGAAFSFLAQAGGWQRWFFALIAVVAAVLILTWLARLKPAERLQGAALALILGGALGNLYDRIVLGHVVDFLDFYWGDYHFPAFNIADSAITIGAALIILDMILGGRRVRQQ